MSGNTRTMAFQIPEDLFRRIKVHLEQETQRTGRELTQREFVLGLIEEALNGVEAKSDHSVSASGENCVRSLASSFPTGPATLGSGGNPDRLAIEEAGQDNAPRNSDAPGEDADSEEKAPEKP